ncbi:tetratricopeptide repeat protein [Moheibacter lacus]|uniref:Tetratricopeptide repeat protein n=1 Tax=Moheibacter lacus TaxID=2745851 RepID=A0A838ZUF6_9FLAO|nr:tetratricopeptide repeat protein [Moheibacter lacus]MBA5630623.1 tetratricopeptide repeat protein [Moheibacter lacus]
MKKIVLSLAALVMSLGVFAQEKEIEAAFSAVESNNTSSAKTELAKVASQMNANTISPELKAKYYYAAGQVALKEGNSIEAAKMFGEMGKFENGTMYSVKNKSTKQTEYYATKADADAAVANGDYAKPKEEKLTPNLSLKVQESLRTKAEAVLKQANDAYQADNANLAGDKFLEASYLAKAIGGDGDLFKYNAALSYHKAENFQKAFDTYKELINEGYTGESSSWVGKDKASGQEVSFNTKAEADTQAKLGLVTGVKEVKSPSVEKELYMYALRTLVGQKKYDPIVEKISNKYGKDNEIQTLVGNVYHNSGQSDLFLEKLIENTKIDPNNATNYFNIGILYMDQNKNEEALAYFDKAIQVDPKFKNAYTNAAITIVKPEKEYIELINANLGNSAKEKQLYKENTEKRKALYTKAIPYLEKAFELDKTSFDSARLLRQAYQTAEMFDKEDAMRAIEKSLEKK